MINRQAIKIVSVSLLALFLELLLIRWISTELRIFAYVQNALLVVCFFGFGAGCMVARSNRTRRARAVVSLLLMVACLAIPVSRAVFDTAGMGFSALHDFVVWDNLAAMSTWDLALIVIGACCATLLVMLWIWSVMFDLGCELGAALEGLPPLYGYSINLIGSLIGILLFTALSALSLPPWVWFGVVAVLYGATLRPNWKGGVALVAVAALSVIPQMTSGALETVWSPYQKLELLSEPAGEFTVRVNNVGYQQIENNTPAAAAANVSGNGGHTPIGAYDVPSRLAPQSAKALVVGAGTGNDVAGILRNTAAAVTAVDIDPAIVSWGSRFHPERPYQSERVKIVIDDARAFFARSNEKFDLIVFGLLDSHTTPAVTNARLDHFVYTRESIEAARRLLSPQGVMFLIFMVHHEFIGSRLEHTLRDAFGSDPMVIKVPSDDTGWGGTAFIHGNAEALQRAVAQDAELAHYLSSHRVSSFDVPQPVAVATDDWPYLYLDKRRIPSAFLIIFLLYGVLAWLAHRREQVFEGLSRNWAPSTTVSFLLGTGFSLLQMFGLSRLAVLFGGTWIVNTIVIAGALLLALAANVVSSRVRKVPLALCFLGTLGSCAILGKFDFALFESLDLGSRTLLASLLVGLPCAFSGLAFSRLMKNADSGRHILGANMLGALFGGALHCITFAWGISAVLWCAAAAYLLAWIWSVRVEGGAKPPL